MQKSYWYSLALLAIGILLFYTSPVNTYLFLTINQVFPNQMLWMSLTVLGDGLFIGCLLLILCQRDLQFLTNNLLAGLVVHITAQGGKALFAVLRPEHVPELIGIHLLGPKLELTNYAMPSGHVEGAFMAAAIIVNYFSWRSWKMVAVFGVAILIALSRIAVGVHWPADCFVGASFGLIIGTLFSAHRLHINFPFVRPITYGFYALFIVFSLKTGIRLATFPVQHLMVGFLGVVALVVWLRLVFNMLKLKAWR
jgi:membrane-associated phospholipid phosphatase